MPRRASEQGDHIVQLYRAIRAVVRRIPRGRVATYGQVAELAGIPGGARVAAAALKTSTPGDRLPWQRVIGKRGKARGRIAIYDPIGAAIQRQLLEAEGVAIGDAGLVELDVYGWLPSNERSRGGPRAGTRQAPNARTRKRAVGETASFPRPEARK